MYIVLGVIQTYIFFKKIIVNFVYSILMFGSLIVLYLQKLYLVE